MSPFRALLMKSSNSLLDHHLGVLLNPKGRLWGQVTVRESHVPKPVRQQRLMTPVTRHHSLPPFSSRHGRVLLVVAHRNVLLNDISGFPPSTTGAKVERLTPSSDSLLHWSAASGRFFVDKL